MRHVCLVLLICVAAMPASAQTAGRSGGWLPLATYLNDAAHESQAGRVRTALEARGIHSVTTCSAGCTMSVDVSRWTEARTILRDVITREHLDIADAAPVATS
jgi:hypothetical protein